MHLNFLLFLANVLGIVHAKVTVYYQQGQTPLGTASSTANPTENTGLAAYNQVTLSPPALPDPKPPTDFVIQLQNGGTPGASIPQEGSFFGFSIEMSVVNQVLGKNASHLQIPFLNLMANIQQRAGRVLVRVGGNTQETATLVDSLPDGRALEKDLLGVSNPTQTPPLLFTPEILYMMNNISSLVNVRWFLGIPFNDTNNFRLGIAETGTAILGDYLIGLQAGNEPDLYLRHQHRQDPYGPGDYVNEVGKLVTAMAGDSFSRARSLLIGPNLAMGDWTPEQIWDTGFVDQFNDNLQYLAMEKYPTDNCAAQFNTGGTLQVPQEVFPSFLTHTAGQNIVKPYLNSTLFAQTKNKKMLMFETNTASCGGFPGISDAFGAALWALDYSLQMAHANFSGALFHVGGQNVFYNPFTSPPTNESTFHQWTVGPIYYSALVIAEALGSSNKSQVLDLGINGGNEFTPGYAIYEDGNPVRVVLLNYMTDASGASAYTARIAIGGSGINQPNASPAQVKVKYLSAASVSQIGNITWANQTFGSHFDSDGRLMGEEVIQTVDCDQGTNLCSITVPAPGAALVFLSDSALTETGGAPSTTFATTALTKTLNTASIDPTLLATSNGHRTGKVGSTSPGSASSGWGLKDTLPGLSLLVAVAAGGMVLGRALTP
ncbi:glycoside hydrolase family 79 protein [Pleurotus ostreatus PC15]|uniref:Glycoside hydrolase family 79 protein n=1 Tax=Pleurotus ostreatus (strain PC15) TaxID=1137138 RepID=A0A067NAA5_PLEO1|nr:glycoside hydrolase family 79 protein [Pleurotus ostreatus PC15]